MGVVGAVWMYLGGEAVMDIGGACGSGGSGLRQRCPDGVGGLMLGGIFGGLLGWALYAVLGLKIGPRVALLAWPGVFLSQAWGFFVHGAGPGGPVWSWLICGVFFAVMGIVPLLFLRTRENWRRLVWSDGPAAAPRRRKGKRSLSYIPDDDARAPVAIKAASAVLHVVVLGAALYLGTTWFTTITGG